MERGVRNVVIQTKKEQGKKNRASGARFELKVRKDLESKGWIVSKWQNNVEFEDKNSMEVSGHFPPIILDTGERDKAREKLKAIYGKCVPAKRKYNPFSKALSIGTGFPDFIVFKLVDGLMEHDEGKGSYVVFGVEVKSNRYLDKKEREKCEWLLKNKIFSRILIASKGKKRGEIKYIDFREKYLNK